MTTRYGATREEYGEWLAARGQPRYRGDQLWDALYRRRAPLESATALPQRLRHELATAFPTALTPVTEATSDAGTTVKWLWRARGGAEIETVLMRTRTRATVCISSQAGCAMGCTFCATGQAGFERHLDAGEIVEQVARAAIASPQPVTNVVFMGMGEPLANFDATWGAIERLHRDFGLSARHLTVSTVGVVPGMRRLAAAGLPVTLAVSLHAPDDALRDTLVPLNRRHPIAEVLDAAAAYAAARGRRVSFEYAVIEGVNDAPAQARALAALLRPLGALGAHVNLIPLNPTTDFAGAAPPRARVQAFAAALRDAGVNATVRRNRGTDIDAACGQLRRRVAAADRPRPVAGPVARPGPGSTRMGR
jgi:23S rRNA (adenine2503-C2)-methyltransferase